MWKANEIIDKLHIIREKHYEETKNLPVKEQVKRTNAIIGEVEKKYGINLKIVK